MQPVDQMRPNVEPMRPVEPVAERVTTTTVSSADRVAQIVYVVFGIIEGLIAIRVVLKLLAANPDAGFSKLIYAITEPFVALFNGVFGTPATNGSVFELTSVLAIIVYALVAWGAVRLIAVLGQRETTTVR